MKKVYNSQKGSQLENNYIIQSIKIMVDKITIPIVRLYAPAVLPLLGLQVYGRKWNLVGAAGIVTKIVGEVESCESADSVIWYLIYVFEGHSSLSMPFGI